ncbi:muscle-specific protein 300 kDa-like [Diorhabda carinulata]|uniref:muscle-specific protein 300 kDa-like n=1 Tax=Diorhabda carinulata TaxID=1163345 RepID=UPI0025A1B560|nr:muscle-specific protein 300 kDa-like [Diorhabda carinulata]
MPIEEIPVHADVKTVTKDFLYKEIVQRPVATIETQTGRSLSSPIEEPLTKDFTVTYNQPVDVQIQTMSQSTSEMEPVQTKETITISKETSGGQETIRIATKPITEHQPIVEEPDNLLVEADYRKRPESETRTTELNITNVAPNQAFETVFVEPDETTTEVIVDADGTKRIIMKKLHRTVVRHQQSSQNQQFSTLNTLTEGGIPVSQSFSQITLTGQQSSTSIAKGDNSRATVTSQKYGGKVVSGALGGEVDIQEYETEPETHYSFTGPTTKPEEVELQGMKLHEGDVTFISNDNNLLIPTETPQVVFDGNEIHTSSSSVRAVVQQVTRRIIRKTRRIIRRTVIIDGKEHVQEEVIEEPEEIEVTEEGIPRVSINVVRTENGQVVTNQQFGEQPIVEEPDVTVTEKVTTVKIDAHGNPLTTLPEDVTVISKPVTEEGVTITEVVQHTSEESIAKKPEESYTFIPQTDVPEKASSIMLETSEEPEERYVIDQSTALQPETAPQTTEFVISSPEKFYASTNDFLDNERHVHSDLERRTIDIALSFDAIHQPDNKETLIEESVKPLSIKDDISISIDEPQLTKQIESPITEKSEITAYPVGHHTSAVIQELENITRTIETACPDQRKITITTDRSTDLQSTEPVSEVKTELENSIENQIDITVKTAEIETEDSKSLESHKDIVTSITEQLPIVPDIKIDEHSAIAITEIISPKSATKDTGVTKVTIEELSVPSEKEIIEVNLRTPSAPPYEECLDSRLLESHISNQFILAEQQHHLPDTIVKEEVKKSPQSKKKREFAKTKKAIGTPRTQSPVVPEDEITVIDVDKSEGESSEPLPEVAVISKSVDITEKIEGIVEEEMPKFDKIKIQETETMTSTIKESPGNVEINLSLKEIKPEITIVEMPQEVSSKVAKAIDCNAKFIEVEKQFSLENSIRKEEEPIITTELESHEIVSSKEAPELLTAPEKELTVETTVIESAGSGDLVEPIAIVASSNQKLPSKEVDIILSLEEKYEDTSITTPKVSLSMRIEETTDATEPSDILQKDVHVQLPKMTIEKTEITEVTSTEPKLELEQTEPSLPSDIDHGGRKSKKKKKHKKNGTPTSEEEKCDTIIVAKEAVAVEEEIEQLSQDVDDEKQQSVITSLAESVALSIPDDSIKSEESPKPTQDIFGSVSESEDSCKGKETGYEADKTLEESLADEDEQEKKKRRKKKKKQKIKTKESEESNVPISIHESYTDNSIQFSDDEPVKKVDNKNESEQPKKTKKRKKNKRKHEEESEPELVSEEPIKFEARDEIISQDDSYHTISTLTDPGTVKVVEESVISRPASKSPIEISSKIVTTVPVVEAIITQETISQTSPIDVNAEFLNVEREMADVTITKSATEQISVQTSPEIRKEISDSYAQTSIEENKIEIKPDIKEDSTQVYITTIETITQTSPKTQSPEEKFATEITEISTQTITPEKIEITEEFVQTDTPVPIEQTFLTELIDKSDSAMQTNVENREESAQTKSPEPILSTETATQIQPEISDFGLQTCPELPHECVEHIELTESCIQTSLEPSAPQIVQPKLTEFGIQTSPESSAKSTSYKPITTIQTTETMSQTSSILNQESDEIITSSLTPTTSTSEQYEIHVKASVIVPSENSESADEIIEHKVLTIEPAVSEEKIQQDIKSSSSISSDMVQVKQSSGSEGEIDVQINIDGKPIDQHSIITTFLDSERNKDSSEKRHRKTHKNSKTKRQEKKTGIEKDLFSEFKRQNTVEGSLAPISYADVTRRSRTPSPVRGETIVTKTVDKQEESVDETQLAYSQSIATGVVTEISTNLDKDKKNIMPTTPKKSTTSDLTLQASSHKVIEKNVVANEPINVEEKIQEQGIDSPSIISPNIVKHSSGSDDEYKAQVDVYEIDKHSAITSFLDSERDADSSGKRYRKKRKQFKTQEKITGIEKDLFSEFKRQNTVEETLAPISYADVTRRSRTPSPVRYTEIRGTQETIDETETKPKSVATEVVSRVFTDLDQTHVKSKYTRPKESTSSDLTQQTSIDMNLSVPQELESPSTVEIITKDTYTVKSHIDVPQHVASFTVDSIQTELKEKELPLEHEEPLDTTILVKSNVVASSPCVSATIEFIEFEKGNTFKDDGTILINDKPVPLSHEQEVKTIEKIGDTDQENISTDQEVKNQIAEEMPSSDDNNIATVDEIYQEKLKNKPIATKTKDKMKKPVTIEEVQSSIIIADTPLTPASDSGPLSPPNYQISTWQKPQDVSASLIQAEIQLTSVPLNELTIKWNQTQALERVKNLQNAKKSTHLSNVLHLATLNEIITDETIQQRNDNIQKNLNLLQEAVERKDVVIIQQTVITTVETITTWLETIEYRIYVHRQQTLEGPSEARVQEFSELKQEITKIENKVDQLQSVIRQTDDIYNEDERQRIKSYIESLQQQVKVIEEVTEENEQIAAEDLKRWNDFVEEVTNINQQIRKLQRQLSELKYSDAAPQTKLNELDKFENSNRSYLSKIVPLMTEAKGLMRDFPTKEIPKEVLLNNELAKQIEQQIGIEREKTYQFLSLADEYEQTLKEFSQIIIIAEALVESSISVRNLEHLEDEMQNHRKFFVNLSHCRAILESLEENLDSETRAIHSKLHQNLYERASVILDKSTGRFQQMSLAASRWTVLEQSTRDELRWLQVAQQRVPELNNVTSTDYERYIDLHNSLAADIDYHHAKLTHLNCVAQKLQELVHCTELEQAYVESLDIIQKLQEDVKNNLERLLAFKDSWKTYNMLSDKVEYWLKEAEIELKQIEVPSGPRGHLRRFWELKAQHEVHNLARLNAGNALDKSLQIVPISDEMYQRANNSELNALWQKVSKKIAELEASILDTISAPDIPVNEKLVFLEQELQDLNVDVDNLKGIIKTEEELSLYVERLQIMAVRIETIQNELSRLGLLSASESEKVGYLLSLSKKLEVIIAEELEGGTLIKERLQAIQKSIERARKKHADVSKGLDLCESAEKLGSESVEKAVSDCYEIGEELVTLWQDLMAIRQLLHTLPTRLKVTVSPLTVERDISKLQDDHTALEKRCGQILALLRSRLALWKRFERQLELVQQSVQEADFMVELLTVQGTVDYERLRKATERLENVSGDLISRENLVSELKNSAKPLSDSCSPEVSAKIEAAVKEAVTAYETTCTNLKELCTKYHHAADLWKQYKEASDLVKEWIENPMESIENFEPEEAIEKVKVCEETLAAHTKRLVKLQELVSGIASAVGLDANALLGGEVEALGKRLEDVRESLTTLADVAESKAKIKKDNQKEINGTKNYLDSVQKNIFSLENSAEDSDGEEKLLVLRDHLLALSKAEGQIQKLKDKTIEVSTTKTETSVIEILELWQQVFRETFQQYHRLSTRLVKNEDSAAVLKLWQEYLLNVQQFLQGTIPGDYHSLSDHQHLCQLHQNLLTTQQNVLKPVDKNDPLASGLVESSVMKQFNSLTNLHNETLSRIMDRHTEVQNRLDAWEKYKTDQSCLLNWLKNIEKERERMQLRYMHIRRIPKLLTKIQNLLDKMSQGEEQADNLQRQQNQLLQFCDDALATSIRMEHVAIKQRLSNLQAGLETWKQFLDRIKIMVQNYEDGIRNVQKEFDDIQEIINETVIQQHLSHSAVSNRLDLLRNTRERVTVSENQLQKLIQMQEQLKECLSPSDMKTINQKMWLLRHQHDDLNHQLINLCLHLEEKLGIRSLFETRYSKFLIWVNELEKRLNQDYDINQTLIEPKELLKKLETELKAEMALKEREYNWLIKTGKDIYDSCGEEYADVTAKQIIQARTKEIAEQWERLEQLGKSRFNKINDLMQTIFQLEERIVSIRAWLSQVEVQLAKPLVFEGSTQDIIDRKIQDHDRLKKSIENESGDIGEVLNLCELILNDPDINKANFSTENISNAVINIEKRWKIVCGQSAERKRKITLIWKLLQDVTKLSERDERWVADKEKSLNNLDKPTSPLDKNELQQLIYNVETEIKDIESHEPAFQILSQTYSKLNTAPGIEPKNIQELTARTRLIIVRWENLLPKARAILSQIQTELAPFKEFSIAHEDAIVGLTRLDAQVTELQHLLPPEKVSPQERLKKLEEIEKQLTIQTPNLENADKLGLQIMKRSKGKEIEIIQEMIDEYQILCRNLHERITYIKTEIETVILASGPQEVDESIQVETLKFEKDTAVQVNTLPPQLQRMTSISAKDAYLVELEAALEECKNNLKQLEEYVYKEIPKQGSTELPISSKKIAKISGQCLASTELIKHLHDLLIDECHATEAEACSQEVEKLLEEFKILLVRAKEKEQKLRELRTAACDAYNLLCAHEAGRILCPLCTKRNWAQLDNDLWRLEKWLQVAEGTQKGQKTPPVNIEYLEDVIQDHREFLLDLDSHKSIVRSLNIVGTHLADHSEDTSKADELRVRLETDNRRWDLICQNAANWQLQLQRALMNNQQFHNIISELCIWLEKNEKKIRASEPVDLTAAHEVIEAKYQSFLDLRLELERCEPRVLSLQEAANQLFREEAPEGSSTIYRRLTELRLKLQSLIKLTGVYTLKLGAVLGRDPNVIGYSASSASRSGLPLQSLNYDLLEQPGQDQPDATSPDAALYNGSDDESEINTSVLRRGCRFLGRVVRASVPIQAVMLLLLGAASLVPFSEDDYSCSLVNSIANSLTPTLRYNDGPPPI